MASEARLVDRLAGYSDLSWLLGGIFEAVVAEASVSALQEVSHRLPNFTASEASKTTGSDWSQRMLASREGRNRSLSSPKKTSPS